MRAVLLGLLAAALLTETVDAQENDVYSANVIVPGCQRFLREATGSGNNPTSSVEAFQSDVCTGTIGGLARAILFLPPDRRSCPPKGVTRGQIVRVVFASIERRPQRMHEDFRDLAIEAMHEAWPCK